MWIFYLISTVLLLCLVLYYKIKHRNVSKEFSNSSLALYFFEISFSEESFSDKLKMISLAIRKKLGFDFVSFVAFDEEGRATMLQSNVVVFDQDEVLKMINSIDKTKHQSRFSKDYPILYGNNSSRGIHYFYYVALDGGGILLESEDVKNPVLLEELVFSTLVASLSNAISFIISANESVVSSLTDHLSGLPNRKALESFVSTDLPERYCVCMCDIDHFKKVNDTYGHETGDFVIQAFSKILNKLIRNEDKLFRIGGEEFLIVFAESSSTDILNRLNTIRKHIMTHKMESLSKEVFHITSSFGVADSMAIENSEFNDIVALADKALYESKSNGRNRVTISKGGDVRAS